MNNKFDVVIVGGGIAGLVAANYLAKENLSVLLIEKHERPGGCCTSFEKGSYKFDVGVHYFGSLRSEGQLKLIFNELELNQKINIHRINPNDVIVMPDYKIKIYNAIDETISQFADIFPLESKKIDHFFKWITQSKFSELYVSTKKLTFRQLLDKHFTNEKLKQTLAAVLGNIGLSSLKASALTSIILYREYILDGGYYPIGGVQQLPNALSDLLIKNGGIVKLSTTVKKFHLMNGNISSVELEDGSIIRASFFIAACDATQVFRDFIGFENTPEVIRQKFKKLEPSMSALIIYLGINKSLKDIIKDHCSHWFSPNYNVDKFYDSLNGDSYSFESPHFLDTFCSFHSESLAPLGGECASLFMGAPYKSREFWKENKENFADNLIKQFKKYSGELASFIEVKEIATPITVYNYTKNINGSLYGWAPTNEQIESHVMPIKCDFIKNLYLAGHWSTQGYAQGGVPVVALAGRQAAKLILKNDNFSKVTR